jgi:ribosome maturation factor RimP
MDLTERISQMIEPSMTEMGYELVRVTINGKRSITLQIMAEPADGRDMGVDDCAAVSRMVSALLDVEDPITDSYNLEVSSPGIDRPLTRLKDFERWAGFDARVEMTDPVGGRRRFSGRLKGVQDGLVTIDTGEEEVALPFAGMAKAKLLLTDELVAWSTKNRQVEG